METSPGGSNRARFHFKLQDIWFLRRRILYTAQQGMDVSSSSKTRVDECKTWNSGILSTKEGWHDEQAVEHRGEP